MPEDGLRQL